jgi:hypothetical protein
VPRHPNDVSEGAGRPCWTRGCKRQNTRARTVTLAPRIIVTVVLCADCEERVRGWHGQLVREELPAMVPEDSSRDYAA